MTAFSAPPLRASLPPVSEIILPLSLFRLSISSSQCFTQESCFLGNIFSAHHAQVVHYKRLPAILAPLSSILFGCGFAALYPCVMSARRIPRTLPAFSATFCIFSAAHPRILRNSPRHSATFRGIPRHSATLINFNKCVCSRPKPHLSQTQKPKTYLSPEGLGLDETLNFGLPPFTIPSPHHSITPSLHPSTTPLSGPSPTCTSGSPTLLCRCNVEIVRAARDSP